MTTENFYLKRFDRENELCEGRYTEYRELMARMTDILDKQGHSGSGAAYLLSKMKLYRQMYLEGTHEDFKIEIEFKDLFDVLKITFSSGMDDAWIDKFNDLLQRTFAQEPLEPIEDVQSDWMEVGTGVYQNKRCSALFKRDGVVTFQGGSVLMEFYKDYDGIGTYLSGSVPNEPVTFPFDPFTHEKVYYYQDRISGEILFHGTYPQIKDRVQELLKKYRRNWLLGLDQEGVVFRPEVLAPVDYMKIKNLTTYFDDVIRPRIDSDTEKLDVMEMRYKDKALFELNGYHTTPEVVKHILYRMAIQYSELDQQERQSMFNITYLVRPVYQPNTTHQFYQHINRDEDSKTCDVDVIDSLLNVLYISDKRESIDNARKYLFEKCKENGLEFKAGKRLKIINPAYETGAFLVDVVLNEDRAKLLENPIGESVEVSEQVEL